MGRSCTKSFAVIKRRNAVEYDDGSNMHDYDDLGTKVIRGALGSTKMFQNLFCTSFTFGGFFVDHEKHKS